MIWRWYGRLPLAECLILAGLGRIVYEIAFTAFTGWTVTRDDFLISLAVVIFGFVLRSRKLRYP
jgi:hypothetical protein